MCLNQRTMLYVCTGKCAWIRELCFMFAQVNVLESENYAVCVCTGKYARIIDGHFATVRAGQRTEKKVTIKTLKEPLSGGHVALFHLLIHIVFGIVCLFCALCLYILCSFGFFSSRFFTCAEMYVSCNFMLRRLCSSKWSSGDGLPFSWAVVMVSPSPHLKRELPLVKHSFTVNLYEGNVVVVFKRS